MDTRPGSREAAKQETRRALLEAGVAEFAERGLDVPSLDAICARAGYTRGAFYVHFRDRTDFVVAVMERVLGAFLDAIIAADDEERGLEQTIRRFTGALVAGPALLAASSPGARGPEFQLHRLLDACARSTRLRDRFAGMLGEAIGRVSKAAAEGQLAGSVRRDVGSAALGTLLVVLSLGAVTAVESGLEIDVEAARDAVLALVKREA
jgi:AcrR family transcriptional regulator